MVMTFKKLILINVEDNISAERQPDVNVWQARSDRNVPLLHHVQDY